MMSSRGRKKTVDCYPMCRMHRACAAIGTAAEETAADGALRILVPISGKMLRDGAIVTTKQDTEEHGYGIKSIKSIAELYGGTADCFVEDSIFYLVVTFPCGKSQKETA